TIQQPTCSEATGTITVTAPTGEGMSYSIDGADYTNTTGVFTSVPTGAYNLTAKNIAGCVSEGTSVTINAQPVAPVAPTVGTITQPNCVIETGSVELTGLPSGNWIINPGAISGTGTTTTISGLLAGTYNYTITNATGCTSLASADIVIEAKPSTPTWIGAVDNNWNNPANWCSGIVPTASTDVVISNATTQLIINQTSGSPVVCDNLTIEAGAQLVIAPNGSLTVNGTLTNNSQDGILIQSDANNTGSLIVNSVAGSGTAQAQRYLTNAGWHMVSAPVSGESVSGFITTNTNVLASTNGIDKKVMDYDPVNNRWNNYFTDGLTNGNFDLGKGFAIHTSVNDIVNFEGSLFAGPQTLAGLTANNWNCIGNPYSSALGINRNSTSANNFLTENALNAANLDPSFSVVYVWDKPDASNGKTGQYNIISNTPIDNGFDVQQGQAFFVKMNSGATSLSFNSGMQLHQPTLSFKVKKDVWPFIKLNVQSGTQSSSTYIAFNRAMTKGLDPTYDAGLLKGSSDLVVYSRLVSDNSGVPFAIQALPDNESGMIIPIGLDYKTGGQVEFSTEMTNMPSVCSVILEDKVTKTFTDISKSKYIVSVDANSSISDRFRLYTSKAVDKTDQGLINDKLTAYADRNIEIRVVGSVSKNAVATLYDMYGKVVLVKNLEEGSLNIIPLQNTKIGAYVLSVNDNGRVRGFKILVRE
ncbi:MAG: T9SS type A sorting domain-containing protein, partial [Bacteroidota bacterium]|nr:T9SS type A sorting domain-containing protein [Bacteroidota bacterium]